MISRSTDIRAALRYKQRGFLLNPGRFAGPSGPTDPSFPNVKLLMFGEGADASTVAVDSSPLARTLTAFGTAQIDTAQFKYGAASLYFPTAGQYFSAAASADFDMGATDYTVEWWHRFASGSNWGICGTVDAKFVIHGDANRWALRENSTANVFLISWAPTFNVWQHGAVCRSGTTTRMFIDGIQIGSGTSAISVTHTDTTFRVGGGILSSFHGHLDDFRLTKGVARYTANFTPPAAQLPSS